MTKRSALDLIDDWLATGFKVSREAGTGAGGDAEADWTTGGPAGPAR